MHSLKFLLKPLVVQGYVFAVPSKPLFLPFVNHLFNNICVIRHVSLHCAQLRWLTSNFAKDNFNHHNCDTPTRKFGSEDVKQFLINYLQCSKKEAVSIYGQNCEFLDKNVPKARQAVDILLNFGIVNETIRNNFWTVFFEKDQLEARLQLLKRWSFLNINNGISILKLSYGKLEKCTVFHEQDSVFLDANNRITYFALFVQSHEKDVCELFMKYKFMLTIKVTYMKEILEILKEQEVEWGAVSRDPWVFRYSPAFLRRRVHRLAEFGASDKCGRVKPWMLRSPELTLNRYFELREENRAALGGHRDLHSLLQSELGLAGAEVAAMVSRHPPLARLRSAKALDMARFLVASGFAGRTVAAVPRALCHKRETLVSRMAELKRYGSNAMSLQNLCRNKKDYDAFVKRLGAHGTADPPLPSR